MPADGKGIYVDSGEEPVDHTGDEPDEIEDDEIEEVENDEAPKPGDADYVDPDADDEEEETPPATLPKEAADAIAFQKYLGTKDGAVDFLIEAGLGLGKSVDELEAFFMGKPAEADDEEDDDDDGVMTRAEYRAAEAKREEADQARRQQDRLVEQAKVIQAVAIDKLQSYKVGEEDLTEKQRTVVANFADTYLDEDTQYDPQAVAAALDQGFKDFTEAMGFTAEGKKVVKRKVVPKGLKGSTGGASEESEPQNLTEAFARARKKLKEQGEI